MSSSGLKESIYASLSFASSIPSISKMASGMRCVTTVCLSLNFLYPSKLNGLNPAILGSMFKRDLIFASLTID